MNDIRDLHPQLANFRDYWLGWGEVDRSDNGIVSYRSGLAHPMLNGVLGLEEGVRPEQALGLANYRLRGVPWLWWVGPDCAPDLGGQLVAHGGRKVSTTPIMAISLDRITDAGMPSELKIETVTDSAGISEWVHTYGPSLEVPPSENDNAARNEASRADADRMVRLVGRVDGEAVGTAMMYAAHGIAGIFVVTTAESHRRRGIATALTTAALRAGRDLGLGIASLHATELGVPVYTRMGFETVGEYDLYQFPTS